MKKEIASDLLRIGAVFLRPEEPFTWASGIKSPIYCDNRLTLSDVTSTAGIAHAAITAEILGLPMGYVRSSAKDHGRGSQIEGKCEPGTKVVVIEDLISTAGSCVEVAEVLRKAGCEVLGIVSIFTYGMKKAADRLQEHHLVNYSASDYDTLLEIAVEENRIRRDQVSALLAFRDNPSDESWITGSSAAK